MSSNTYMMLTESVIKTCAMECMAENPNNSFVIALEAANKFKEAELTPIYMLNPETMDLLVLAAETYNKKLH